MGIAFDGSLSRTPLSKIVYPTQFVPVANSKASLLATTHFFLHVLIPLFVFYLLFFYCQLSTVRNVLISVTTIISANKMN